MKITTLTNKINLQSALKVVKTVVNEGKTEHYQLLRDKMPICSFDFTNFRAIDGYFSHAEIKNFQINSQFRRKKESAKALLQAKSVITVSAKEKGIKFIMFSLPHKIKGNVEKLLTHLGAIEYQIEDLLENHFIGIIDSKMFKKIQKRQKVNVSEKSKFLDIKHIHGLLRRNLTSIC